MATLEHYNALDEDEDVPLGLRHGKAIKPFGRYLRRKLRKVLGRDEKALPALDSEMQTMWSRACDAAPKNGEARRLAFRNLLIDASEQKVANMKARMAIFNPRGKL